MKSCHRCGELKTLDEFNKHSARRDGLDGWCKTCSRKANKERGRDYFNQKAREYRANNPLIFKKQELKKKFGMSLDCYFEMWNEQEGLCAICREPEATRASLGPERKRWLSVDHNNRTGEIRQLLCDRCNRALGLLRDRPDLARAAADYLEKHNTRNANEQASMKAVGIAKLFGREQ